MAVDGVGGLIGEAWIRVRPATAEFAPELKRDVSRAVRGAEAEAQASVARTAGVTGTAVTKVSHHTRAAYSEVAMAEADLAATTATYGRNSAEAAVATDRLNVAHKKLGDSMLHNETKAARLSGRIGGMGHGIVRSSGSLLLGGLAIEEFGRHTAEAAVTYEEAMTQVQNATGETDTQVKDLSKGFLDVAKSGESTFSAGEAATAYGQVAGQLKLAEGHALSTAQALQFMKAAENDAEASGQDLGQTTSALGQVMQTFHIPLSKVSDESDVLYNVSKSLNVPISAIATAVDRMHARLGAAAPSLGDVSALMIQASRAGVTGSRGVLTISSAMQTLLSNATKTSKGTKASLQQIEQAQISLQTSTDAVTTAQAKYGPQSEQYKIAVERQTIAQQKLDALQKGTPATLTAAQQTLKDLGVQVYDSTGKFVGMSALIDQLQPKLLAMSDAQRNNAVQTLFGKSNAQLMLNILMQGQAGWTQATDAANQHGTAQEGAAKKSKTLTGDLHRLNAELNALETEIGGKVIPVLASMADWLTHHTVIAETLAGVIGGLLVLAVGRYVGELVWSSLQTAKHIGQQIAQWTGLSKKVQESNTKIAASSTETAGTVEADAAAEGTAMEGVGTAAGAEAAEVGVADAEIATESTATAATVEADAAAEEVAMRGVAATAGLAALAIAGTIADVLLLKKDWDLYQQSRHLQHAASAHDTLTGAASEIEQVGAEAKSLGVNTKHFQKMRQRFLKQVSDGTDWYGNPILTAPPDVVEAGVARLRRWVYRHSHAVAGSSRPGVAGALPGGGYGLPSSRQGGYASLLTGPARGGDAEQHRHHQRAEAYANATNGHLVKLVGLMGSVDRNTAETAQHVRRRHHRFDHAESR